MIFLPELLTSLRDGGFLGVQYNPLFGAITAALAAALWGYPKVKRDASWWSALVLAIGWLAGDGLRILGRARDYYDGVAAFTSAGLVVWPGWVMLGTWAVVSLGLGYVFPALAGGAVGRRVTHGTGWLAAAAIAATLTIAISAAIGALG